MSDETTTIAGRSSLILQLHDAVYRDAVYQLHKELPPPDVDDPELLRQIIEAAIADIASMLPANGDETRIAVRTVVADARADECARHARALFNDHAGAVKCLGLANNFTRTANASRALLHRVQAARRKHEAIPANCEKDCWTEEALVSFMAKAHRKTMPPAAAQPTLPAQDTPPTQDTPSVHGTRSGEDPFAAYTEAERYAILYPYRAAGIRAHGGVPPDAPYEHPGSGLVADIVASTSDVLVLIDEQFAEMHSP
jgi:hypothetical protein